MAGTTFKISISSLGFSTEIKEGQSLTFGRSGGSADCPINDQAGSLSRVHFSLAVQDGRLYISDLNSTNGVQLNGHRLNPNSPQEIDSGHSAMVGQYPLEVEALQTAAPPAAAPSSNANSAKSAPENLDFSSTASIEFLQLSKSRQSFTLGRGSKNDFVIDPSDLTVSREHARMTLENGQWYVEDLNSRNGVFVNNQRVFGRTAVGPQDKIYICLHLFNLESGYVDLRKEVAIQAEGIEKKYPNGYVGLKTMDLNIPFSKFIAVMGPSGCGKSTLLKVLNADSPATSGSVKIHGLDLVENFALLKKKIGYVPQDDIIHRELTVEQTMFYCAKLRLPKDTPKNSIDEKISTVLHSLFDEDKVKAIYHKRVNALSGGERKRLSIAVELLTDPTILFLDEPTSPLDPESIHEFLTKLNDLKAKGTTIIMVTHKPEDLNYVDDVVFLGSGGMHVYYGHRDKIMPHFNKESIVEVYGLLSNKTTAEEYYRKKYVQGENEVYRSGNQELHPKKEPFFYQLKWLIRRYFQIKFNDKGNLGLLLAQPLIIGGLISVIFKEFQLGAMFLMSISAIWFGVSNAAKEIVSEQSIYKRERMFNLWINTYIISKISVLAVISAVQLLVFEGLIYFRFKLFPPEVFEQVYQQDFLATYFFLLFLSLSASLLGLVLSAVFDNSEKVMTVVPIALMPQIMLAGVITRIDNWGMELLSFLTIGRWGTEGLARIQDASVWEDDLKDVPKDLESVIAYVPTVETDTTVENGATIITSIPNPAETEPTTRSALSLLDFYNEDLVEEGTLIGDFMNSMGANMLAVIIMNIIIYLLIYAFLKKKDSI